MRARWLEWMRLEDEFFAVDGAQDRATFVVRGDSNGSREPELYEHAGNARP